jgi:hypothetical protein
MVIPITTNIRDYFRYYLTILNPLLKLKQREIDILSYLLLVHFANHKNPNIDNQLLTPEIKKTIRKEIKMSEASFNNHISALRKKNMLTETSLNPTLLKSYPTGTKSTLTFNFTIE